MKIHHVQQGSLEWAMLRCGIPTASEFGNLVTPDFKIRTGEMPKTFLNKKLAEKWQGAPLDCYQSHDMELGTIQEEEAIPYFTLETGIDVERVGFVTSDDGRVGCSPDGLLPDSGIEIKCPRIETHVGYLLASELPKDYAAQVHGSMFVTGRTTWRFMSYRRRLPALMLTIERDEKIQATIRTALEIFNGAFDDAWALLCEKNGGPPRRSEHQTETKTKFVSETPT